MSQQKLYKEIIAKTIGTSEDFSKCKRFIPDEGYPFAAVEYSLEDDEIIVKSCRY